MYDDNNHYNCLIAETIKQYYTDPGDEEKYLTPLDTRFDFAMVEYTRNVEAWGYYYLTHCRLYGDTSYSYLCTKEKRKTDDGCVACPANTYASATDEHRANWCGLCKRNFYYTDSGCVACPEGMVTSGEDFHHETECRERTVLCPPTHYFAPETNTCIQCPPGSVAVSIGNMPPMHTNTACEYCPEGFYWDGTGVGCSQCPFINGVNPNPDITPNINVTKHRRPITECAAQPGIEFTDESGTFSFTDTCLYSE